jgi:hypothetical protein
MSSKYEIHMPPMGGGGGGGGGQTDHFAPKYLVGNVPAGDPNLAQAAPFIYIPDIGDGSGIALALTQPNGPGDVWIRPGAYNLNNGMAGPLVVPPGVRVQGAGATTNILGKQTGDQGVFVLSVNSQLRDLNVTVPASSEGSITSVAAIRSIGAQQIENVTVNFTTAPGGVLRQGIRFEAAPGASIQTGVTALRNVLVATKSTTGIQDPTICYWVDFGQNGPAFANADNMRSSGGDVAVVVNGILVARTLLLIDWTQYGVWAQSGNSSAFRVDESLVQVSQVAPATTPIGVFIQIGGGHVLRAMSVQVNTNNQDGSGIVIDPIGGGSTLEIDDGQVFADIVGVQIGSAQNRMDDVTVADSTIQSLGLGIDIQSPAQNLSSLCHIKGNTIGVFGGNAPVAAIRTRGTQHEVEGNAVQFGDQQLAAFALDIGSTRTSVRGNSITFLGAEGIRVGAERVTCVANIMETGNSGIPLPSIVGIHVTQNAVRSIVGDNQCTNGNTYVRPSIVIDANQCTVGDNTTFGISQFVPTPGIELNGANCTCIGNVCEGVGGVPVANTGLGNEIAHNVAA